MNAFDIQSALEVADKMRSIARRADTFGYDRERLIEELIFAAECYELYAERIENLMIEQMAMIDSDGAACNQLMMEAA